MKDPSIDTAVEMDDEVEDPEVRVIVKCPFCQLVFVDNRTDVEETLYRHLWKVHDSESVQYMVNNMYIPEEIKAEIFDEMGSNYISWLVNRGEIDDGK